MVYTNLGADAGRDQISGRTTGADQRCNFYFSFLLFVCFNIANAETLPRTIRISGTQATVKASSELIRLKAPGLYSPVNAFDGNSATAWVEGNAGSGEGEWIELSFNAKTFLDNLRIVNGYRKNDIVYKENGRIATFDLSFDGKPSLSFSNIQINTDTIIQINRELTSFRISVVKTEKGSKYDDLCVTEITPAVKTFNNGNNEKATFISASSLLYSISKTGISVTSTGSSRNTTVFDTTIPEFSSFLDAKIQQPVIAGLERFKIFELTVQYEYDKDVFLHLFSETNASLLFFHEKSISSDGSVEYRLKQPIQLSAGRPVLEFYGDCTYPECDSFQQNIKFVFKNDNFVKE